jgi:hypothetical protein
MVERFADWTHVRVQGDRQAAAPHLPAARKLLGEVFEEAARNGLGVFSLTRDLQDGTVIVAEKHGDIPRITIVPPAPVAEDVPPTLGDFVVWARDVDHPVGIDDVRPQHVLRHRGDGSWRSMRAASNLAGRSDSTYGRIFPEGLRRAGNVDWLSKAGERLSWYGPQARSWLDAYVHPRRQYGTRVYALGQPVFDADEYIAATGVSFADRWVLGAALRQHEEGTYLYVVHSVCTAGFTDMTPIGADEGRITEPVTPATDTASLCRYRVTKAPDAANVWRYSVMPGSRQVVMVQTANNEPWFFSPDGARAVVTLLPVAPSAFQLIYSGFTGTVVTAPAANQRRLVVAIDDGGAATIASDELFSATVGGAAVPLASEWDRDGQMVDVAIEFDPQYVPWLLVGGARIALKDVSGSGSSVSATKRWVMHANARDALAVTLREHIVYDDSEVPRVAVGGDGHVAEVWRSGELADAAVVASSPMVFGPVRFYDVNATVLYPMAARSVYPLWFIYGVVLQRFFVGGFGSQNIDFLGANISYMGFPHAPDCYFGTYDEPGTEVRPPTPIASQAIGGFNSAPADFDGYFSLVGAAAHRGATIVSMGIPVPAGDRSYYSITNGDLPALTGIGSFNARYHPVWVLGRLVEGA